SQTLKLLQRIRDEAHRFGITFHRNLRSKAQVKSALRDIKGVGEQTENRLLMHFGSVARIASASIEDIAALVGAQLAERIHKSLNEK
ncbi:MAG: excinuclease ABC subunit C, partial [Bacteroidales bacterium]|nr:excinuclease ABC subunit C [Bacteroidales bacterium]